VPDQIFASRPALPHSTPTGDTVTHHGGVVYLNGRPCKPTAALAFSAAIARAVRESAEHRMTNPNQTTTARR
jgi:hypothetical protein